MYSGIIQTLAKVKNLNKKDGFLNFTLEVEPSVLNGVFVGASCAVNGACFTVVSIKSNILEFDAIQTTLKLTTIGELSEGDLVHFERSLKMGDENGGHHISGHIHGKCKLSKVIKTENNVTLRMIVPDGHIKYIFDKGFISLHGASLTVSEIEPSEDWFEVSLIPETLKQTIFSGAKEGGFYNYELEQQTRTMVDVVERTLERLVEQKLKLLKP
jgi:riboflavin synthase